MSLVDTTVQYNIGTITLNNPKKLNSLSKELVDGTVWVLPEMKQQRVRAVILRAPAGSKVFSAGHDVRELPTNGRDPLTYNDLLRLVVRENELFHHAKAGRR